mgnify:FL=1
MSWLLKDSSTGEFFTLPQGAEHKEWSADPLKAHQFLTEDRARSGAEVWQQLHNRALTVIDYNHAVQFEKLRSND